MIEVAFLKYRN